MKDLVNDIVTHATFIFNANLDGRKVERLLLERNIKTPFQFGEHYQFNDPYKQFFYEYLGAA